ncbi:EamA family transporter RarD [Pseudonocardia asaccharolytica]|uniref:Putative RarD protein n=1 Tax=Pseudonocardia asaccharolytica DSM 44247 = NBRC 16224 TaxID=1123024 RepID=A0A511D123_9PSEU|nr:EamA family transporter RarD [Pseudonocardia asaccharolytica]GEL18485.1 putative RarD protein [Pseudonocardia asaccharolytica DSM 44247 = NBRC 16224]
MAGSPPDYGGVAFAVGAYTLWGLFPAFWPLLEPTGPVEVLGHRIAWTLVLMAVVLTAVRGWSELRKLSGRGWLLITAAAVLIAANWGTFIYGVAIDHVVDVALGYYVSPLVSVLLGVTVLGERLRRAQWAALAAALAAVLVISVGSGVVPWLSLVLAGTFGLYGLLKKTVPLSGRAGLTAEGMLLGPLAIGWLLWLGATGSGSFGDHGLGHALLLMASGPVTAVPLLLFAAGARRIPLSTIGVLQYLTPTLQFIWGVAVVREPMSPSRWIGFGLVWLALMIFTADLVRQAGAGRGAGAGADLPAVAADAH